MKHNIIYVIFGDTKRTTVALFSTAVVIGGAILVRNYLKMRSHFKRINIPGPTPLPIFGNFLGLMKKGNQAHDMDIFKTYGKTVGYFEGAIPVILTNDIKFMKAFLIKDFGSFVNRRTFESYDLEPTDKFLMMLRDDEWKNVRSILTSTFTSGKLKLMSKCMIDCIKNFEKHLEDVIKTDGVFDAKELFGSYSLDVIISCCFGTSISERNSEFLKNVQEVFSAFVTRSPKFLLIFIAPKLSRFLAKIKLVEFFPSRPMKFLEELTNVIIGRRKAKLDVRDDFIQSMIEHEDDSKEVKNSEKENVGLKRTLTNREILSQAVLFLLAGYETTATTLEWVSYCLAKHQDVQDKLIAEIDQVLEKHNGGINYESIMDMKYMDMVVDEALRMYPPLTRIDREASVDYEYEGIKIKKGQAVVVPIYSLHHDPELYADPEEFIPERFSDENKKSRETVAFLPFGTGPRNCIGMRFALVEVKLLLATILAKHRFFTFKKTPEKFEFIRSGFCRSKVPILLKIQPRNI